MHVKTVFKQITFSFGCIDHTQNQHWRADRPRGGEWPRCSACRQRSVPMECAAESERPSTNRLGTGSYRSSFLEKYQFGVSFFLRVTRGIILEMTTQGSGGWSGACRLEMESLFAISLYFSHWYRGKGKCCLFTSPIHIFLPVQRLKLVTVQFRTHFSNL